MSGQIIGLLIEIMVAVLLGVTILYCVRLNRRLERLRADEHALRNTISELVNATQIAERAILGLKTTVRECDSTLGERLRSAERFVSTIDHELKDAREVLQRITQIADVGRSGRPAARAADSAPPAPKSTAASTLAAANAFAARARARGQDEAA